MSISSDFSEEFKTGENLAQNENEIFSRNDEKKPKKYQSIYLQRGPVKPGDLKK